MTTPTSLKGLLVDHYALIGNSPYECVFILNDEEAFKHRLNRQFGQSNTVHNQEWRENVWPEILQFFEDCRYSDGDYSFPFADSQYVIYIHHYLMSLTSINPD